MLPAYNIANGDTAKADMEAKQVKAVQDAAMIPPASEWAFHDFILGAKAQVKDQFGDSPMEIQSMGLKKKSEYKSPSKKKTP